MSSSFSQRPPHDRPIARLWPGISGLGLSSGLDPSDSGRGSLAAGSPNWRSGALRHGGFLLVLTGSQEKRVQASFAYASASRYGQFGEPAPRWGNPADRSVRLRRAVPPLLQLQAPVHGVPGRFIEELGPGGALRRVGKTREKTKMCEILTGVAWWRG